MKKSNLLVLTLSILCVAGVADAKNSACPPGLAKKAVPCVPPGLAKQVTHHYQPGVWIGDDDYHRITYPDRYGLPALPRGQRYVILGNQIMVVSDDTYCIISILRGVDAILD